MTSKAFANATDANRQQGGRRNLIINGAMQVAQRGTSFSSNNSVDYTVDRWGTFANGQITTTQETFTAGQTAVPNEPTNYVRWNVTSYNSGDNFFQKIEDVRTLAGQSATLSFYAKSDTNITTRPRFIQNFGSGGSSDVVTTTDTADITTSWQKFVITTSIPSISGKTIGTSSYLEIELLRVTDTFTGQIDLAQVQLEVGDTATPFEHRSYGEELALCERYFQRSWHTAANSGNGSTYPATVTGRAANTIALDIQVQFRTQLRSSPTFTFYRAGVAGDLYDVDTAGTLSSVTLSQNWFDANGINGFLASGGPFSAGTRYGFDFDVDAEL